MSQYEWEQFDYLAYLSLHGGMIQNFYHESWGRIQLLMPF